MVTAAASAFVPVILNDVRIEYRAVQRNLEGATATGVLWQAAPGRFLLEAPGVARFLVTGGIEIAIDAEREAPSVRVAGFLRMAPLAALLYQRGILACHAAAVSAPGGAVLIAGVSAAGKSSVAASLVDRGCDFLADDLVGIDLDAEGRPVAHATEREIALWPDAVAQLFPAKRPEWASPLDPSESGLQHFAVAGRSSAVPVPLRAVYYLASQESSVMRRQDSGSVSRFELVTRMCFNSRVADTLLDHTLFLRLAGAITCQVAVKHIVRSRVPWQAGSIADRILEDRS